MCKLSRSISQWSHERLVIAIAIVLSLPLLKVHVHVYIHICIHIHVHVALVTLGLDYAFVRSFLPDQVTRGCPDIDRKCISL